ncbi:SWIM-type domain-containing protein [Aphis craccivora]|uniref:SWIM-type domain-containing protein n=1 Tax=Aphis craccivora TaxID=307492 RepID=A0A6G0W080_APHCR|nr:SWIM-type domain-containing protein [Aphis craccivora]
MILIYRKNYICHHSSHHKVDRTLNKKGQSKNTDCKASIKIVVKVDTVSTRKSDPFVKNNCLGMITISNTHNHNINTAEALRYLNPDIHLRKTFEEYFYDGMTISDALRYHESILTMSNTPIEDFANGRINPTYRCVQNWHDQWRVLNLGPRTGQGVIMKLEEKKQTYATNGISLYFQEEPFAILILTPIMKRAHDLPLSKDIVFVDSTSSCDPENHCITFLLTPCAAGAAPLGVIISKGQSEASYSSGFNLIKQNVKNAFSGQGYPSLFLTDNSDAEINALKIVWPQSRSLLCIFHVLQSVWRWLWDSKNNIKKEDRTSMMHAFRKMLYAQTYEEAQEKYVETMNIRSNYPMWQKYITVHHWKYKENWCLAWRDHTNRGHQTNNFSEVSVRIFKENVLGRLKAYNNFQMKEILLLNYNEEFYVPSEKNKKMMYCVEPNIGVCSCEAGIHGQFCKHQCIIYKYFKTTGINFPPITVEDKYLISKLALGDRAPPPTFYEIECNKEVSIENNMKIDKPIVDTFKEDMDKKKSFFILKNIHSIMINNVTKFGSSYDSLLKFKSRLEKIKSEGQFNTFLATAGSKSTLLRQRDGAAIRVQPTTISRRKPGMTRGSKRLPSGRPASTDHNHQKKKPRNVFKNVTDCVPNAKSH